MADAQEAGEVSSGYVGLRERAVKILAKRPDGLDADALARELFGADDGRRWAPLLVGILGGDPRLDHSEGRWRRVGRGVPSPRRHQIPGQTRGALPAATDVTIVSSRNATPGFDVSTLAASFASPSTEIVALALATTGADPRRHRIVRIGVVRREGGEIVGRLDLLVGTGEQLAGYLRRSARVGEDDLDAAPELAEIVPTLREAIEAQTVYVYGARRAEAFLNAELRRADLPSIEADFREIDDLLKSLLPTARKPGLAAAADELGLPPASGASPLAEAGLAARVVERLQERQAASPSRALVGELTGSPTESDAPLPFTHAWLRSVPNGPGVYLFLDANGGALYVGKALDLPRRLASYLAKQPSQHRGLEALGVRTTSVQVVVTRSDLEATLLEARLIRKRSPELNVARRTRGPTTIIRAAPDEPRPSVRLVADQGADGARYFGPFESVNAARQAMGAARAVFPEAFARRVSDVGAQRRAVLEVCRLFSGQKAPALDLLRQSMQEAANRGERAEVDRLHAALKGVQALVIYPSPLAGLGMGWRLLALETLPIGATVTHLIEDGRRRRSMDWQMSALPSDAARLRFLATRIAQAPPDEDDPFDTFDDDNPDDDVRRLLLAEDDPDEPAIVMRWLTQARTRIQIERVPPETLE